MGLAIVIAILVGSVTVASGKELKYLHAEEPIKDNKTELYDDTELLVAFVITCNGDRTNDLEDLNYYPSQHLYRNMFFPFDVDAITNKGKQRIYYVGKYLRELYDGFISKLYHSTEIQVRSTDFGRTKMTALTILAAMYPPEPEQKWNPDLLWLPIPYSTVTQKDDDLLFWRNCPKYLQLKQNVYDRPEALQKKKPYQLFFTYLTQKMGRNITNSGDVYYLDNYFQALSNVEIQPPKWAQDVMPEIKYLTKIDFAVQFCNNDLIKLASGVLMNFIINKTTAIFLNVETTMEPKLYLFSGHDNNVAALMAASRVYEAHQPYYGATFSLQFRRQISTNEYGILAIYARDAGGPGMLLPIHGCGENIMFCPYSKFIRLIKDVLITREEYHDLCKL